MTERIDLTRPRAADSPTGGPRLLLTNDDGVGAPGLGALAARLEREGYDVVVAAPDTDVSGCGTGIGGVRLDRSIEVTRVELPGVTTPAYALPGPPGLAVMAGALGAFGARPAAVVSGINAGSNLGTAVIHSGTVGAALTAATFDLPALAVSLAPPEDPTDAEAWAWSTAAAVAVSVLRWMGGAGRRMVLNLNVPSLPLARVAGPVWADLADFGVFVLAAADPDTDGGRTELRVEEPGPPAAGSDRALVRAGHATLSELRGLAAVADGDRPGMPTWGHT